MLISIIFYVPFITSKDMEETHLQSWATCVPVSISLCLSFHRTTPTLKAFRMCQNSHDTEHSFITFSLSWIYHKLPKILTIKKNCTKQICSFFWHLIPTMQHGVPWELAQVAFLPSVFQLLTVMNQWRQLSSSSHCRHGGGQ